MIVTHINMCYVCDHYVSSLFRDEEGDREIVLSLSSCIQYLIDKHTCLRQLHLSQFHLWFIHNYEHLVQIVAVPSKRILQKNLL